MAYQKLTAEFGKVTELAVLTGKVHVVVCVE